MFDPLAFLKPKKACTTEGILSFRSAERYIEKHTEAQNRFPSESCQYNWERLQGLETQAKRFIRELKLEQNTKELSVPELPAGNPDWPEEPSENWIFPLAARDLMECVDSLIFPADMQLLLRLSLMYLLYSALRDNCYIGQEDGAKCIDWFFEKAKLQRDISPGRFWTAMEERKAFEEAIRELNASVPYWILKNARTTGRHMEAWKFRSNCENFLCDAMRLLQPRYDCWTLCTTAEAVCWSQLNQMIHIISCWDWGG